MPRNYQSKNAYNLPHNVYMQVIYIIKDYSRMLKERQNILYSGSFNDGQPKSINKSDPTADKALKLAILSNRIDAIDKAIHDVNAFYSNKIKRDDIDCFNCLDAFNDYGYFCYVLHDPEKNKEPAYITWKRFRAEFVSKIARNLNLF